MKIFLIILGSLALLFLLFLAVFWYISRRNEGDRDWLLRVTNKKNYPD